MVARLIGHTFLSSEVIMDNKGFTLIELMIVVFILGIMLAITIPKLKEIRSKIEIEKVQSQDQDQDYVKEFNKETKQKIIF